VADQHANASDVVAGAVIGAVGGALLGGAIDGREGAGKGALIGGAGGAVLTGTAANDRWQRIYRRAYAECRAS
jgi:outer membrane lipoprotein SlyB